MENYLIIIFFFFLLENKPSTSQVISLPYIKCKNNKKRYDLVFTEIFT
jgi:hypothetical protein